MNQSRQAGFTLVEMLIVVIMTTILSVIIFNLGYQYLKQAASLNARANFYGDRLTVADYLRQNVGLSTGLLNQNSIDDTNPIVLDPSDANGTHWLPIHAIPASLGTPADVTPIIYFSQNALDSNRKVIMNGTKAYQNEYILYHDGPSSELRIRTLANPSAPGNSAKTTCSVEGPGCRADKVLLTGVQTVEMKYYSRSGEGIDFRSSCDPDAYYCAGNTPPGCLQTSPYTGCNGLDFSQVEVAQFKIKVKKSIESDVNHSFYNSTIIRIALRNA